MPSLRSLPIDDQALTARAVSGSRPAFEALVQRYAGRVVAVLERRIGDLETAHDLCQEVWIRVHRAFQNRGFDPEDGGSFRSWLFAIALNLARDEARSRARRPQDRVAAEDENPPDTQDPRALQDTSRLEHHEAIESTLARIDEPFQTAVVLVDVEGLEYEEAARVAGCALGTMKSRVARGRAAFRDLWQTVVGEDERRDDHRRDRTHGL